MKHVCFAVLTVFTTASHLAAQAALDQSPPSKLRIETQVAFTEGPAWHSTGSVFFTDVANSRIMRLDAQGELHIFRQPSGRANGLWFDPQQRLLACEGAGLGGYRRVTRTESDGTITVLADRYQGKRFNSPNDITMDSRGRIYFTDPRYGDRSDLEIFDDDGEAIEGVYRIDAPGNVERILEHEVDRPNGILVSARDRFLYVADNVNDGPRGPGGNRKLWRFDLQEDGSVDRDSRHLMFDWGTDRGPDGMTVDELGNLYVAAGFNFPKPPVETAINYRAGVYVISPEGKLLRFVPIPEDMVTNCTLGGPERSMLYVTAGHKLWSLPLE